MKTPPFACTGSFALAVIMSLTVACENKDQARISTIEWLEREQERSELAQKIKLARYTLERQPADETANLAALREDAAVLNQRITALATREAALRQEIRDLETRLVAHADAARQQRLARRVMALGTRFPTLVTRSGQTLEDASVASIEDSGVTIRHRGGLIRLDFHKLTEEQRDYFGLEEVSAAASLEEEKRRDIALNTWGVRSAAEEVAARDQAARAAASRDKALADNRANPPPRAVGNPAPFPTPPRPERAERYRYTPSTVYYYYYTTPNRCATPRGSVLRPRTPTGVSKSVPGQPAGVLRTPGALTPTVRPPVVRPPTVRSTVPARPTRIPTPATP